MKKIIGIGLAVLMVVSLGVAANASATAWTMVMKAGNGTTYLGAQGITQIGIAAAAAAPTYFSAGPSSTQAGFYGVDPDPAKFCNKDIRAAGLDAYTWNMKLATGTGWTAQNITIGWNFPASASAATTAWTFKFFREGQLFATVSDAGSGYSGTNLIALAPTVDFGAAPAGKIESWQIVASKEVVVTPEPGSILAMLSGLVGLAGYSIRRRK